MQCFYLDNFQLAFCGFYVMIRKSVTVFDLLVSFWQDQITCQTVTRGES